MKTYFLKVREKFIDLTRTKIKKFEYRLGTIERKEIKIGDTLVLISNQNSKKYVRVTVKAINHYENWTSALGHNWQENFKDVFNKHDELLHECYKFYKKEDVDKFGIIRFAIEPILPKINNMDILLDTNIIIKREGLLSSSFEISKLFRWFDKRKENKFIHPQTIDEINKYKDEKIKNSILRKINAYNICDCSGSIVEFQDEYFKKVISEFTRNENADVDNILLWEIYCNNFDLLVTDDKEMLMKAEKLFIRENVKTSVEMLQRYEKNALIEHIEYPMLSVKLKKFSEVNLNDQFFNTLREDSEGKKFDDWFKRKTKNEEKAYVFQNKEGLLKAFLYIKKEESSENYDDIEPVLAPKKRLKIGTFKVDTEKGFRLGERFLKIIFNNAIKQDVEEIYVTLFENKRKEVTWLRDMMKEWGFEYHGEKISNKESVFVKKLKSYNSFKSPKFNFPNIQKNAESYILPISSEFHTKLFPDNILKNEDMTLYEENLGQYYALEKIYLTKAPNILAKKGDLILIYRMGERYPKNYSSAITGIAMIEDIIHPKTIQNCIETCKNKSVFSVHEIRKVYSRDLIIIKLLDYKTFNKKVILEKLYDLNVVNRGGGPRPFTKISKKQHDEIIKLGGIN